LKKLGYFLRAVAEPNYEETGEIERDNLSEAENLEAPLESVAHGEESFQDELGVFGAGSSFENLHPLSHHDLVESQPTPRAQAPNFIRSEGSVGKDQLVFTVQVGADGTINLQEAVASFGNLLVSGR
jgi:hypothetical protein